MPTLMPVSWPFVLVEPGGEAAAPWTRTARAEQRLLQVRIARLVWPATLAGLTGGGVAAVMVLRLLGI
jgi:hypothetical protein